MTGLSPMISTLQIGLQRTGRLCRIDAAREYLAHLFEMSVKFDSLQIWLLNNDIALQHAFVARLSLSIPLCDASWRELLPDILRKIRHELLASLELRQNMMEMRIAVILVQLNLHTILLQLVFEQHSIIMQRILVRSRGIDRWQFRHCWMEDRRQ